MRSRATFEPMSSNEAVTIALNSAILSAGSAWRKEDMWRRSEHILAP